jgi:MFS family permease
MTNAAPILESDDVAPGALAGFFRKFTVLRNAMRELWLVFAIKLLVIAAYGLTNSTIVLWLSSDFGYSDQKALGMVFAWSLLMSIFTLLVGSLTDAIGMRKTFFLGVGLCIISRGVMAFTTIEWLALAGGLFPLAVGEALTGPVLVAAARRYSTTKQRAMSFSLIYTMMNVGFLVGSLLFDYVRKGLGEHGHLSLPGMHLTTYQTLLLVSMFLECAILPLIFCLREGAEATDEGVSIAAKESLPRDENMLSAFRLTLVNSAKDTVRIFTGLWRQTGFYRLLWFLVLIAFLKLIFMQMYYVFPAFGIRVLGDGAPVGRLWAINSIFVIVLVPIVGALTQRFSAYAMVIFGGGISVASVFIMALPPVWFEPLANGSVAKWIGGWYLGLHGNIDPYYVMIALFVVLLSIGESFYSPRVYEYAAAIAPRGQEASYSALSYVPILLAKMIIGVFSGTLLSTYCPKEGVRHPEIMWLFVALTGMVAPVGLLALRRFIRVHEAGRED